ncbi:MAG: type II secretion system F family protein [Acidimicrobiia bacterium]|nr:type II secretion system F family protein [Acidimicrobiia bacterium]
MRIAAAGAAAVAVYLFSLRSPVVRLVDRVGTYLMPVRKLPSETDLPKEAPLAKAGLDWSSAEVGLRRTIAGLAGGLSGVLLAQGDLFLAGSTRSAPALGAVGAFAGVLGFRIWVTQRTERRARQLHAELPVIADLIALRVLAGESVASALEHVVEGTSGIAAAEFREVLERYGEGLGLSEALQVEVGRTVAPEAGRLYGFLANAHQAGGRLAEALLGLSIDYRAEQERELQVEGGKRALAVYAPILALMIPVALLFLMYPTLEGLSGLSTSP